jgi:hypothetical protein
MSSITKYLEFPVLDVSLIALAQGYVLTQSVLGTAGFAVCKLAGAVIADEVAEKYNPTFAINRQIAYQYYLPKTLIGSLPPCIKKLAPIVSLGIATATNYVLYNSFSSMFAKALIIGWHSPAARDCADFLDGTWGVRKEGYLRTPWKTAILSYKDMSPEQSDTCKTIAMLAIAVFYSATSIGLTFLKYHPILATTSGWVAAAIASVITTRLYKWTLPNQASSEK